MAYQAAREGHPQEAITLIDTAMTGVRGKQTSRLLTALYSHQAYTFTALEDSSSCTAAISKARAEVERVKPDDDLPYLYWVGPADITAWAGLCLLTLRKPDQAAVMLEEGIGLLDESFVRDRRDYSIRLAEALTHPGPQRDLDAAVERGRAALHLSENLRSANSVDRFRDLVSQLRPHTKAPAVRDFVDRTRELVRCNGNSGSAELRNVGSPSWASAVKHIDTPTGQRSHPFTGDVSREGAPRIRLYSLTG
jgi:hypothetical protein